MQAAFVELPAFERTRKDYLDDEVYRLVQLELMENPTAGAVIEGTGGLRKLRQADPRRSKGKRGGLPVIYYWCVNAGAQVMISFGFLLSMTRTKSTI